MGILGKRRLHRETVHLSDKDPKEQQGDVPCEEQEAGTDPQLVEQVEVQQSSDAVKRVGRAVQMQIQCFTNPCFWNVSQKEIHNNVVPDRVKGLSGAALHQRRQGSLKAKVFVLLNSEKRDIVHVVDHTQHTVRQSNEGSSQQKDEVMLVQTHLMGTVSAIIRCARVGDRFISAPDGDGTTPSHDYSHDAVGQGVDELTRVEQLTQQGNFRACNRWDDCIIFQVEEPHHDDDSTQQDEGEDGTCTR